MAERNWPFADPERTAVFTTRSVMVARKRILHVSHDADDGAWQFHHEAVHGINDSQIVALSEVVALHPEIAQLADLPLGWTADRRSDGTWERQPPNPQP
jgi:hypothetical protein